MEGDILKSQFRKIFGTPEITNFLFVMFMLINFLWHYKIIP
jgi:hypothetical protein